MPASKYPAVNVCYLEGLLGPSTGASTGVGVGLPTGHEGGRWVVGHLLRET